MNAPDFRHAAPAPLALEDLPFDNSFARLPDAFHTRLPPWGLPDPYRVAVSAEAAALIGLDPEQFTRPEFAEIFAGNRLPAGSEPLAAVYSGHQFGVWAGQLGDGRAHLLGGVRGPQGTWEIQLKGAGRTPYSRMGDGRAVLRSSIREFLCSEAMAALSIPTTRALCIIGSDAPVRRETVETAAVVTRLAPSFLRFGSFEHWRSLGRDQELKRLADYFIARFRPELLDEPQPYQALLADVARRTGELMARWTCVGFMHGVMNTDNMSLLGLTLDYGPFGFMEAFDGGHVCNHSDPQGRYAYAAQPHVAHWNLQALGHALAPLTGDAETSLDIVDATYPDAYNGAFLGGMRAKLGLAASLPDDEAFITDVFALLQAHRPDFTLFFRRLGALSGQSGLDPRADDPLRDQFVDRAACDAWLTLWRSRLAREGSSDADRQSAMNGVNPKYILRNWIAESAIRKAQEKDYSEIASVLACLARPFEEQPEQERYAAPPPDWASGLEVSCSS
ncbi:MAG: YdiU family protein [Rhodocyclaceae bacterium]|nr:YdiU family protein [Rhodocyclaceae bacterium]